MRKILLPSLLLLLGCAEPLRHQETLGALHTRYAEQCKASPQVCAVLQPCTDGLTRAISVWQGVTEATAKGDTTLASARTADALISEGAARGACIATTLPAPGSAAPTSASPAAPTSTPAGVR